MYVSWMCQYVIQHIANPYYWGRHRQEPSSQLITLKSQIFPVKDSNLPSPGLVGLVANSSVYKTRKF